MEFVVDDVQEINQVEISTEFITGSAGTGKTTLLRKRIEEDPNYGIFSATTGIAAINLGAGVTTINSLLGFYNYESAKERFTEGWMTKKMCDLVRDGANRIIIDEVSMMDGRVLDKIYQSALEATDRGYPIGLVLTGDFCQLPPVMKTGEGTIWAFEADCWKEFSKNITRLTKIWRQDNPTFLNALNSFRAGKGIQGVEYLSETPAQWLPKEIEKFNGTTILPKNDMVDSYNQLRLNQLPTKPFQLKSYRWAIDPRLTKDWDTIPYTSTFKEGALVMILSNDTESWCYANGSLATILGLNTEKKTVTLRIHHNKMEINLPLLVRNSYRKEIPPRWDGVNKMEWPTTPQMGMDRGDGVDKTWYDVEKKKWVWGSIYYYPIRLAWATTVHKSQGLSLDEIQVNCNDWFFGKPGMAYVALSRVRRPEGLHIIGSKGTLARRCSIDPKIVEWL